MRTQAKYLTHPLVMLFHNRRFDEDAGMNWLQGNGWVSDLCVSVHDVAPVDVIRVLTAAMDAIAMRSFPFVYHLFPVVCHGGHFAQGAERRMRGADD